jgi:two-component system, OmpR family, alkaline phosphatase synthesis response regulator PhoP
MFSILDRSVTFCPSKAGRQSKNLRGGSMAKAKVLLIDDEKDFCFFVQKNLELTGEFEVAYAYNGEEGFALAKQMSPDIILLDILMPGMDGGDVKAALNAEPSMANTPVAFLTAAVDKRDFGSEIMREIRNHKFIAKPISPEELIKAIKQVLSDKV